jgi:DNA-binding NarL/FixJ family response regulator
MTLLLADDQSIILDGLEALLAQDDEVQVVGHASTGKEAVERTKELNPDVVLMDINMPEMDGIEATREVLKHCKDTRVLVLSMYGHSDLVHEVMEAGASGYVLKNVGKDELRQALRTIAAGQRYVAKGIQALLDKSVQERQERGETSYSVLTKREKEVVKLICRECTTPEIAAQLFLSTQTVDTHRKNIMHKLGVKNTAGLVKYAMERGWG